jgi:hypothetical protein
MHKNGYFVTSKCRRELISKNQKKSCAVEQRAEPDYTINLLEHFHQFCSVRLQPLWLAVFLAFGGVLARSHRGTRPCSLTQPCQKPKTLALHRYIISVNAPDLQAFGWNRELVERELDTHQNIQV